MHSLRPLHNRLRRLAGQARPQFYDLAVERWEISPAEEVEIAPGIWLPDQVEQIAQTEFGALPDILAQMRGDPAEPTPPTMGYRFRDVDFVDGVLHARGGQMHLRKQSRRGIGYPRPRQAISGALYESWIGNRWFGNWLLNDCLAYRLAELAGHPVTSAPVRGGHIRRYEELLGMTPGRIGDVHFDELVLFDDLHNNRGRQGRAQENRARLLAGASPSRCPASSSFAVPAATPACWRTRPRSPSGSRSNTASAPSTSTAMMPTRWSRRRAPRSWWWASRAASLPMASSPCRPAARC